MTSQQADFILSSREHLALFERSLLSLEKAPTGEDSQLLIDNALRSVHSLKGDAGFLGYASIRDLAHSMENILDDYRDRKTSPSSSTIEALLLASDRLSTSIEDPEHCDLPTIKGMIQRLQGLVSSATNKIALDIDLVDWYRNNQPSNLVDLCTRLESLGYLEGASVVSNLEDLESPLPASNSNAIVRFQSTLTTKEDEASIEQLLGRKPEQVSYNEENTRRVSIDLDAWQESHRNGLVELFHSIDQQCTVLNPELEAGEIDLKTQLPGKAVWRATIGLAESLPEIAMLTSIPDTKPDSHRRTDVHENKLETDEAPVKPNESLPSQNSIKPAVSQDSERIRSLRINVELLDRLMNLIGELTLIRNQTQVVFGDAEGESRNIIQRLNGVTSELQETVLQTRMQPVGNLFGRFPRMVRDLARQLGKEVEVVTQGQEVELDKTVLERLSDPLTHLIRNSMDHGIETPDLREASGKPRGGTITLSATPADGQVSIVIRDDGRGIDPDAVKAKAIAMGLRSELEVARMTNRELNSLILLPGFSTAKKVTDVSGRGVGMDVVKTNIEELEGSLSIESTKGHGTTIHLRVPLTLAIVPCLVVKVNGNRFCIPQRDLEEVVCLHPHSQLSLEQAFDTEAFRLRDTLLPVVRFSEVLARAKPFSSIDKGEMLIAYDPIKRDASQIDYIMVLRSNGHRFGLLVDHVLGREEIVVKPMHPSLRQLSIFSGATLMGDGSVALIANVEGIVEHARCFAVQIEEKAKSPIRDPSEVHRVLLFDNGCSEQYALPLIQVRRVELLEMSRVEKIAGNEFVTIEGLSTRILRLNAFMNVPACEDQATMFLILPKFVPEPMGILCQRIIDTESLSINLQSSTTQKGILGTSIVRDRMSLFLDIQQLREFLFGAKEPSLLGSILEEDPNKSSTPKPPRRILLVDDTPFFREIVKRYLADDQTEIVTAVDGHHGLEKLAESSFDLVLSDIEMPKMDGWQFCKAAREKGYRVPFVALTSLSKGEHEEKAMQCGFDDFEEKLDHDRLKKKVAEWLERTPTGGAYR